LIRAKDSRARLAAELGLLCVAAVWGATFVVVKEAVSDIGPLSFVAERFGLALVPLLAVARLRPGLTSYNAIRAGVVPGLCLFGGYFLQTAGLAHTTASSAGFLTGLSVVFVAVGEAALRRGRPAASVAAGVALAVLGTALLTLEQAPSAGLGELLVLACAVCFALHILALGRVTHAHGAVDVTLGQVLTVAVAAAASAAIFERPLPAQLGAALPAAVFTGLLATVGAFYVQTRAQRHTSPTHTALIFSTEPVFAALFASLLADEQLGVRGAIGCAFILAGMLLAQVGGGSHDAR
jgi:drug/metabolite transporter (DMT)-like permease